MTYSLAAKASVRNLFQHSTFGELTLVGIVSNTGVVASVGTREGNEVARRGAATAGDLELVASGVELGARVCVRGVESDGLVADEVVAGLDARGDGVLNGLAVDDGVL